MGTAEIIEEFSRILFHKSIITSNKWRITESCTDSVTNISTNQHVSSVSSYI